jgi:hypothetical protein
MGRVVNVIPVRDANGDEVMVYEREIVSRVPVLRLKRKLYRFQLETGEHVEFVDAKTFVAIGTGERLVRQPAGKPGPHERA